MDAKDQQIDNLEKVDDTKINSEIAEVVNKFENMDADEKNKTLAMITQYHYQGPLPLASELKKYNDVDPKAHIADRIVKMAENEQKAQIELNFKSVKLQGRDSLLGALFAFVTVVFTLSIGALLVLNDKSLEGMIPLVSAVGCLAFTFIKKEKKKTE